jgi:hypothetical protein
VARTPVGNPNGTGILPTFLCWFLLRSHCRKAKKASPSLTCLDALADEDECKQPHRMDVHFGTEGAPKSWRKRRLTHEAEGRPLVAAQVHFDSTELSTRRFFTNSGSLQRF